MHDIKVTLPAHSTPQRARALADALVTSPDGCGYALTLYDTPGITDVAVQLLGIHNFGWYTVAVVTPALHGAALSDLHWHAWPESMPLADAIESAIDDSERVSAPLVRHTHRAASVLQVLEAVLSRRSRAEVGRVLARNTSANAEYPQRKGYAGYAMQPYANLELFRERVSMRMSAVFAQAHAEAANGLFDSFSELETSSLLARDVAEQVAQYRALFGLSAT